MKLYKLRINEQQKVNAGELGAVLLLLTMILYANRHVSNFDEYFVMLKLSTAIGYFIKFISISIKCIASFRSCNSPLISKTISTILCISIVYTGFIMTIKCFDVMVSTLDGPGIEMAIISVLGGLLGANIAEIIVGFIPDPRKPIVSRCWAILLNFFARNTHESTNKS